MDRPSTGWVTVLAGRLACGSLPVASGLPRFFEENVLQGEVPVAI